MRLIEIIIKGKHPKGMYECKCGNRKLIRVDHVNSGKTKSCGCSSHVTHGQARKGKYSKEYITWQSMKNRCYLKSSTSFKNYGGRGITVCDEWKNSFEQFLKDMGSCPSKYHSIDRIDNDKGYFKENCRWSTNYIQSINKRGKHESSSKYKGVSYIKRDKKYQAQIQINKKTIIILRSTSELECAKAYNREALKYFGKDAFLNEV